MPETMEELILKSDGAVVVEEAYEESQDPDSNGKADATAVGAVQSAPTEFKFAPFSTRQKKILTWWMPSSPFRDYDGIIADGSIRSGKTMSMSLSFCIWAMQTFDQQNFGLCGKSIGSLRRNVINGLKSMLTARGYSVQERRGDNLLKVSRGPRSNNFYMFGGRDESSQDLIQGVTLAGVLLDEVALMPESFVNQATGRCSVEGAKLWFNCNPDNRLHWFKLFWINLFREKRLLYLHFTMDDNLSLSEHVKERYRSRYVGVFYRRYILGEWVSADGIIYDMWSGENTFDPEELKNVYVPDCRRYVACDYGTTNPMVFLKVLDDGSTFWITDEYYHDSKVAQMQKTDTEYANDFEKFVGFDHAVRVILDPSAESFKMELRNRGYHVVDADNTVLDGIRVTATMIQRRRLRVQRGKCPNLLNEVESYIWDEKASMRGEERPVKEHDHAMDAMRYLCKTLVNRRRLAV